MATPDHIHIKIPPSEKKELEAAARALSISLSAYVRMVALREARKGAAQ